MTLFITKTVIDYLFIKKTSSSSFLYNKCEKVWGHRGYFRGHEQNSLESYEAAFNLDAKGTELDIFYDYELKDYVVSHDFPYNLKDQKLLMLNNVFNTFGNTKYYWLDFKNLKDNVGSSVLRMEKLTDKYNVKNVIIIESKNVNDLYQFSKAGFNTSYWITFSGKIGRFRYWGYSYLLKVKYILGYFSAISMNYNNYSQKLKESFPGLPVLLFTVNNRLNIEKYITDDSVRIILTDENYYSSKDDTCVN